MEGWAIASVQYKKKQKKNINMWKGKLTCLAFFYFFLICGQNIIHPIF